MQCVRCGRILNLEERRCPGCLASLSNDRIGQAEAVTFALRTAAECERANMWGRQVRRAVIAGAVLPPLVLVFAFKVWLIVVSAPIGAAVAWFIAWRSWGHNRCCAVFTIAMVVPTLAIAGFNPFTFLLVVCTGTLLGVAINSTRDL